MTRANFTIITKQGKFKMQSNSSAYPSNIMDSIIKFATSTASRNAIFEGKIGFYDEPASWDLATFIESVGLTFGWVGNPTYFYEINFIEQTIKVFGTKSRWINAPIDWEAKGWRGLYIGKNGKMGYKDCNIKGKCILNEHFINYIKDVKDGEIQLKELKIKEALTI